MTTHIHKTYKYQYQYWVLTFFIASRPLALLLDFDKGQNLTFLMEFLLMVYTYQTDVKFRKVVAYKLNVAWGILVLYHWINHGLQQVPHEYSYLGVLNGPFHCYFLLVWTSFLALIDSRKTLYFVLWGYTLFVVLGAYNAIISTGYNFQSYESNERLSGDIHLTQLGSTAGFVFFILTLLKCQNNISYSRFFVFSLLPFMIVLAAGSRNGLIIMIGGLLSLFICTNLSRLSTNKILIVLLASVIIYVVISQLLENTYVGERLLKTREQAHDANLYYHNGKTGTFLDDLGDRTWFYIVGFKNFMDHPIFGIGFHNFQYYNKSEWIVHPEYILHLAEGGIVAITLFLYFISNCLIKLFHGFIRYKSSYILVLLFYVIIVLVVSLSTRIFNSIQYWPLFGLCVALFLKPKKKYSLLTIKHKVLKNNNPIS